MSPGRRDQIIAYYAAGWTISQIAAATGLSVPEVRAALTRKED